MSGVSREQLLAQCFVAPGDPHGPVLKVVGLDPDSDDHVLVSVVGEPHFAERWHKDSVHGAMMRGYDRGRALVERWKETRRAPRARKPTVRRPSQRALEQMVIDGVADAIDGCGGLEPDGTCEHGCPSWLMYLGYV